MTATEFRESQISPGHRSKHNHFRVAIVVSGFPGLISCVPRGGVTGVRRC